MYRSHGLTGFEIIVVDDGSTDETSLVLEVLADLHTELRPLRLKASVGQSGALTAGIRRLEGTGSQPWMPIYKTIRRTWSNSGKLWLIMTWPWAGGLPARTAG